MSPHRSRPARCRPAVAAGALGLALALAGCSGEDGADAGATASPTTPPTSPVGTPTPQSPSPSTGDGARGVFTTSEVRVVAVDADCVYVVPEGSEDLLALRGEVPEVAVDDVLTVSGAPDDTDYPQCPDGRPFLVTEVTVD